MVTAHCVKLVHSLRNALPLDEQVSTLRRLKNELVGHDQRKELVVKQGIVDPLVQILSTGKKTNGKRRLGDEGGAPLESQPIAWTQEYEVRLQATLVLNSLASAGEAFEDPLFVGQVPEQLLAALVEDVPARLTTATLQALRSLLRSPGARKRPLRSLFDDGKVQALQALLCQSSALPAAKQQLRLCCEVFSACTVDEELRTLFLTKSVVDTLASLLASHSIANQHFEYHGNTTQFPPSPPSSHLPEIITTISKLVAPSVYHTHCFILTPALGALFAGSYSESLSSSRGANPTEHLLPPLYVPMSKSVSFNGGSSGAFPALSTLHADPRATTSFHATQHSSDATYANGVVGWLLFLARSMQGYGRLAALRLLAIVNNALEAEAVVASPRSEAVRRTRERERQMVLLAVPLAVSMVQVACESKPEDCLSPSEACENQAVSKTACKVLALLVDSNRDMQTAAVEAGVIKRVCQLLKRSFDNVPLAKPIWSARAHGGPSEETIPDTCKLGERGLPSEILHAQQCRKSALCALAALAKKEDLHRKAIVEAGVVPCIIDSLKPFPPGISETAAKEGRQLSLKDGNTTGVIRAACLAARSLSRSVSLLRTSLIDAGIAKHVFELLKHPELEVKIAATDVCCNLLLEFSPMREELLKAGVIRTLVEHAKQNDIGLRLTSMWALKHVVLASNREIKLKCLEELGTGWLVSTIQGEQRELPTIPSTSGGVSLPPAAGGLSTPNAAGEQVDLLNPSTMDVDYPPHTTHSPASPASQNSDDPSDGSLLYDESSNTHYQASSLRSTLHPRAASPAVPSPALHLPQIYAQETSPLLRARRDDAAIQEQALDFLRNFLNGEDCPRLLDTLFAHIGSDQLFALITEKLAPLPTTTANSPPTSQQQAPTSAPTAPTSSMQPPLHNPPDLLLATVHLLVHLANAAPAHRTLLTAQRPLLTAWLPHFAHPDRRVRLMCVWTANSLLWVDDEGDRAGARQRVTALREAGVERAVRGCRQDEDLDVRERVRTAIRGFENNLGS